MYFTKNPSVHLHCTCHTRQNVTFLLEEIIMKIIYRLNVKRENLVFFQSRAALTTTNSAPTDTDTAVISVTSPTNTITSTAAATATTCWSW